MNGPMSEPELTAEIVDRLSLEYNKARHESGVKTWQCTDLDEFWEHVQIERFEPKVIRPPVFRAPPYRVMKDPRINFLVDLRTNVAEERWSRIEDVTYQVVAGGRLTALSVKAALEPSVGKWRLSDAGGGSNV